MFHGRKLNNQISRLHKRCLRLNYSDRISSYEESLDKYNSVPIHMFKTYRRVPPQIMNKVFSTNCPLNYNLNHHPDFASTAINAVRYGLEPLCFLGSKIWEMLTLDLKNSDSLDSFKSGIKKWRPQECPSRLCKRYIHKLSLTQISKWFWFLTNHWPIIGVCLTVLHCQVVKD